MFAENSRGHKEETADFEKAIRLCGKECTRLNLSSLIKKLRGNINKCSFLIEFLKYFKLTLCKPMLLCKVPNKMI